MALERRPLKKGNMIMMQKKKEKDKQYEANVCGVIYNHC